MRVQAQATHDPAALRAAESTASSAPPPPEAGWTWAQTRTLQDSDCFLAQGALVRPAGAQGGGGEGGGGGWKDGARGGTSEPE